MNKLGAAGTINISAANGAWTELGVNGTNAPVPGAVVASGVSVSTADDYVYVDATAVVQSWVNAPASNNGFIITPNDGTVNVAFDSKESTTTSHPATLTITLTASGAAGPTGPTGPTGINGSVGPSGTVGPTGAAGPAGAAGATGAAGPAGAAGATGAAGPAGAAGATGPAGAAGVKGATGAAGANGATGPAGANGTNGTNGATGPTGTLSNTFFEFNSLFNDGNESGSALYFSPVGTLSNNGATSPAFSNANQTVVPLACTMSELSVAGYLTILEADGSPGTLKITLYHATGAAALTATAITCTTPAIANTLGSVQTCSDLVHTVSLAAGDLLSLQLVESAGSTKSSVVTYAVHLRCQ